MEGNNLSMWFLRLLSERIQTVCVKSLTLAVLFLGVAPPLGAQVPGVLPNQGQVPPESRILVQVAAETESLLSSPMVGFVVQIPSRIGSRFNKGDILVRFDCTESAAKAQMAQSELTMASEALEAKIRLKALNAVSEIEVTTAAAQVAKAQAQLRLNQYQVDQCNIVAPFDGFVVRVIGKPFQTANVGQPLIEIISAEKPKLRVSASSKLFTKFTIGTLLKVLIDETGLIYDATITKINARIDPVNQSFEMEAHVDQATPNLLPGMSGTAVIIPGKPHSSSAAIRH